MSKRRGNGEGNIYRRKDGLYEARYTIDTPTGPKRKSIYAKTRKEADEKLTQVKADRNRGLVFDGDDQPIATYLENWLENAVRDTVKQTTFENYAYIVRQHLIPELGSVKLKDLKPDRARRLYRKKLDFGLSRRTVRLIHTVLSKSLKQAVLDGILPRNVCEAVKAPRNTKREMHPLSPAETRLFLETAKGDRLEALYVVAISTGLREGELLGLRWTDVNLERGAVQVRQQLTRTKDGLSFTSPKRGKSRNVKLTEKAVEVLKDHYNRQNEDRARLGNFWKNSGLVFTSTVGTPMDVGNLTYRSFRPLLKRAGLPQIRVHDLRHTAATLLLGKGVHPKIVQEMLGHSTIAQTMDTYSHVLPDMQEGAVAAMQDTLS